MKKMNSVKKIALGTALSGALIVGAGFGTYSWFTSEASVSGEITNGTLLLNANESTLFEDAVLAPSRTVSDSVIFSNDGTEDMYLRASWDFQVTEGEANPTNLEPNLEGYLVNVTVNLYGEDDSLIATRNSGNLEVSQVQAWIETNDFFPGEDGATQRALSAGESIELDIDLTLKSTAGNEYQGAKIEASLEVEAKQTDDGAEF